MKQAWLAIDGGGTQTSALLLDTCGRTLATAEVAGINRTPRLPSRSLQLLSQLWERIQAQLQHPVDVTRTYLALAGPSDDWQEICDHFSHLWGQIYCFPDSIAIASLARDAGPGMAIHAGTGSFSIAWLNDDDPRLFTAGGAGWILGDPGSGVDFGKRALYALRTEPSDRIDPLLPYLQTVLKRPPQQWVHDLYAAAYPAAELAKIAPAVLTAADEGVPLAQSILSESVQQLAQSAWALGSSCFADATFSIAISGKILTRPACLQVLQSCFSQYGHRGDCAPLHHPPLLGLQRLIVRTCIDHFPLPEIQLFNHLSCNDHS